MIGVDGQWVVSFSLSAKKDFISSDQLLSFTVSEEAGGKLPSYILYFKTTDALIVPYINELNTITCSFGKTASDMIDFDLRINSPKLVREGQDGFLFHLEGLIDAVSYLTSPRQRITDKVPASTAIEDVVKTYFDTVVIDASNDSQRWIQPLHTDRLFVENTYLHADYGDGNFPMVGISSDNEFKLRSIKNILRDEPKHVFSYAASNSEIQIDAGYSIRVSSPLVNTLAGYGTIEHQYDLTSGKGEDHCTNIKTLLAFSNQLNLDPNVEKKRLPNSYVNDNVHKRYNKCYANNIAGLAAFSSMKINLSYSNKFHNVKVLDLVIFKDDDLRKQGDSHSESGLTAQLAEYYTGLYIVSRVSRTIQKQQLRTEVDLCREAPSDMKKA